MHAGFASSLDNSGLYDQLQSNLTELLQKQPVKSVYFLGHSLGAAMAAIAAPLMKAQLQLQDVHLWTFGSPRVGNQARQHAICCCGCTHQVHAILECHTTLSHNVCVEGRPG